MDDTELLDAVEIFEKNMMNTVASNKILNKLNNKSNITLSKEACKSKEIKQVVSNRPDVFKNKVNDIKSITIGESKSVSGQQDFHRKKLLQKQQQYEKRQKVRPKKIKINSASYNFPIYVRNDPNFQNFLKMRDSKRNTKRNQSGQLTCIFCTESFFRIPSSLHRHYVEQHYENCPDHWIKQYYECNECDLVFKRKEHYNTHCLSLKHIERCEL